MRDSKLDKNDECPFCNLANRIIIDGRLWIAIEDAYPVNTGHTLIITRRHVASFREITKEEFSELSDILQLAVKRLDELHKPAGYNFGVNDGADAGQTIFHVHFHVIPRYKGDDEKPRGGVRKVKPPLKPYEAG